MKWSDISDLVGKYAPMVGTLIGGPPGAAIGAVVASTLGVENTPNAVKQALTNDPKAAIALKQMQEKNKHQYEMMLLEMQKLAISEQAKTARAELASEDDYVKRWRPTFGYVLALSFLIWTSAFSYLLVKVIDNPSGMSETIAAVSALMGSLSIIWGMALAVLGINVRSRSKDKLVAATGKKPPSLIQSLLSRGE